ncbi:MAG: ABC transporter permease subunit [Treponema sp.]|nr:ABC transporter permease subunit [Treponema sp.]
MTDDEQIMIDSLTFIINKNFMDQAVIFTATSGTEALEIVAKNNIDIIFMDINMPGLNGLETVRYIKHSRPESVVIILSAFDEFQYAQEAVNLGAFKYLTKPVNRNVVIDTIRSAMDSVEKKRGHLSDVVELHKKLDLAATFFALFFHAFPGILLLILLQLFASVSGLFPVTAYPDFPISEAPVKFVFSYTYHIFLPLFASFLGGIGGTMRMIRSTMLDQMGMPYIMALRARGISERRVYLNHAFRNTLNPYITGSANLLAGLFSGSLVLEIIFSYPGMGRLMYDAVMQQDVNLVLANNMFISALVLLGMTISDILLAIVDPRIRYGKN